MLLEKSQPKPEILRQMVKQAHCFVCNQDLDQSSKSYIEDKLIPVFEGDSENDTFIDYYSELKELFQAIKLNVTKYKDVDEAYYKLFQDNIGGLETQRNEATRKKNDYIASHGESHDVDEMSLETYEAAVEKAVDATRELESLDEDIEQNKKRIESLEDELQEENEPEEVKRARNLKNFANKIYLKLSQIKIDEYTEFRKET